MNAKLEELILFLRNGYFLRLKYLFMTLFFFSPIGTQKFEFFEKNPTIIMMMKNIKNVNCVHHMSIELINKW